MRHTYGIYAFYGARVMCVNICICVCVCGCVCFHLVFGCLFIFGLSRFFNNTHQDKPHEPHIILSTYIYSAFTWPYHKNVIVMCSINALHALSSPTLIKCGSIRWLDSIYIFVVYFLIFWIATYHYCFIHLFDKYICLCVCAWICSYLSHFIVYIYVCLCLHAWCVVRDIVVCYNYQRQMCVYVKNVFCCFCCCAAQNAVYMCYYMWW